MTRDEFNAFCASLPATTNVVQWGGASVWKVGDKMFAIGATFGDGDHDKINFKCSDMAWEILRDQPGIVPAPYLARAKWVQVAAPDALSDDEVRRYIEAAHATVAAKLTKAKRAALGL
jgi:predicted DNA-binding protein (MmcQ/YjbR family)